MKLTRIICIPMLLILMAACTSNCPPLSEEQKDNLKNEVSSQWAKISEAVAIADAQKYASYLSEDLTGMYSHGSMIPNKQAYLDSLTSWFSSRQSVAVNPLKISLTVIDEDYVMLDQLSDFQVTFKDGQLLDIRHAVSFLFRKEDAGWMIIHGHESW